MDQVEKCCRKLFINESIDPMCILYFKTIKVMKHQMLVDMVFFHQRLLSMDVYFINGYCSMFAISTVLYSLLCQDEAVPDTVDGNGISFTSEPLMYCSMQSIPSKALLQTVVTKLQNDVMTY